MWLLPIFRFFRLTSSASDSYWILFRSYSRPMPGVNQLLDVWVYTPHNHQQNRPLNPNGSLPIFKRRFLVLLSSTAITLQLSDNLPHHGINPSICLPTVKHWGFTFHDFNVKVIITDLASGLKISAYLAFELKTTNLGSNHSNWQNS